MVPPGSLRRLLRPRRIAVVGGLAARRVAEQCDRLGFDGEVWPVHPQRKVVEGRRVFASLDDLPGVPDAAFVGVNRHATVGAVAKLAEIGAGGAVCYASGFREAGDGAALEKRLLEAAGDMPIVGPNCYGLVNFLDGAPLWPDQHGGRRLGANARGVAIVTQSSNIAISMTMQRRGLPLAYIATAGNQAQLGVSALASALLDDDRVSALGLHIEGFDSIAQLEALAAKARRKRRPIVALKTGRSTLAQAAALSHTASIAGSDAGADALLRRLGIARATDLAEFLETLKLLHVHGALGGARLGAMCCSGGEASLLADAAQDAGVALPPLAPRHASAVSAAVHELVAVANPLDYHTFAWGDADALCDTFSAFANAPLDAEQTEARGRTPFDALMLVLDFPRGDRCDDAEWHTTLAAFERAVESASAKGVVAATLGENLPEAYAEQMTARQVAPLGGLREALAAIAHAAAIGRAWQAPAPEPTLRCEQAQAAPVLLDEAEAKARLARYGICVPAGGVSHSVKDALAIAETLGGSVAAKALGIAHKSERGAVRLDLRGREQIAAAAEQLLLLGDGLLVERHHNASVCELIVGARREPTLGMMLTIGSGGTLVELLRDTATLLLPTTEGAVRQALANLRCWPLLQGYRGRPKADVDAAVKAILAIAHFAEDNRAALDELDVNPLAVGPEGQGAVALDALLRIRESRASNRQLSEGRTMTAIRTRREDAVLEVTLDRPKANAIDLATSREMGAAFKAFRDDPTLRVAIVTGAGRRFFCAGWDLKAAAAGDAVDGDYGVGGFGGIQELPDMNKPLIAAVNGMAVGGGWELALSCDLILAATEATFALPEIRAGTLADAATVKLPKRMPYHVAMEVLLTGRWVDAAEAQRWGVVNEVVPADDLLLRAWELARALAKGPPLVFAAIKEAVREAENMRAQDALSRIGKRQLPTVDRLYDSEDQREGARAFAEKREPVWKGR